MIIKEDSIEHSSNLHWIHWTVIAGSLIVTIGAWYFAQIQVDTKASDRFDRRANHVVELISERMLKYEDALWGGVAAIQSHSDTIDYKAWQRFSNSLYIEKKYPGINGIGVIIQVMPDKLEHFLAEQRKIRPSFKIHPKHNGKDYFPIVYIEPVSSNALAVGLDMAHETNRYNAALKAKNLGVAQITGPITLIQDTEKTPGFLFFAPFYDKYHYESISERQKNFKGIVYAPFIVHKLMEGTLDRNNRQIGVNIKDGDNLLYNENTDKDVDFDSDPLFKKTIKKEIYGRPWVFSIQSKLSFRHEISNNTPSLILIGGILIDLLLFILFTLLSRKKKYALNLAHKLTKDYQRKAIEAEEQKKRYKAIFKFTADGLITINKKGIIEDFNPACEIIFGYKMGEIIGKNVKILMPKSYSEKHDLYLINHKDTNTNKIFGSDRELQGLRKDGSTFPLELSISVIKSDKGKIFSGIIRDITIRKQMENMKDEFISTVSHELRTPITSIKGSLGLLNILIKNKLNEKENRLFEISYDNCNRLAHLVNDILDMEKIASGKIDYTFQDIRISKLVKDIIDHNASYAEKHKVRFELKYNPTIDKYYCRIDPDRFTQALVNLLSNAAKFSPNNDIVTISMITEKEKSIRISVKDNGLGISESFKEKIFDKFSQEDSSSTRSKGGTGLGLNITKSIIEIFDGELSFDSQKGSGTVFHITLPIYHKNNE